MHNIQKMEKSRQERKKIDTQLLYVHIKQWVEVTYKQHVKEETPENKDVYHGTVRAQQNLNNMQMQCVAHVFRAVK